MELKLLNPGQMEKLYERDLRISFPPAERRPLDAIRRLMAAGRYEAWGLWDGTDFPASAFLWLGAPGWILGDYLCVSPDRRCGGLGAALLDALRQEKRGCVLFGEVEAPQEAPDAAMARRRLDFYGRTGARTAEYEARVFGVRYRVLYWADRPVESGELAVRHDAIYRRDFSPARYAAHVRIPWRAGDAAETPVPWNE